MDTNGLQEITISSPENSDSKLQIRFEEFNIPELKAGEYKLSLTQQISAQNKISAEEGKFTITKKFAVQGERFALNPQQIYSCFPAANSKSDYTYSLPHIVLSASSLPWQREAAPAKEGKNYPWLALLLFYENEDFRSSDSKSSIPTVGDLTDDKKYKDILCFPKESGIFVPTAELGEKIDDNCSFVDIALQLFDQVAPSIEDLPYLAHVRQVSVVKKSLKVTQSFFSSDTIPNEQKFAVVTSNRLPPSPQGFCTAHLVSLEDIAAYLPNPDGSRSEALKNLLQIIENKDKKYIRLPSLTSWSFAVFEDPLVTKGKFLSKTFRQLNKEARDITEEEKTKFPYHPYYTSPITLQHSAIKESSDMEEVSRLNEIFSMGYVPLPHDLRGGSNTVSWYRGPLVPYKISQESTSLETYFSADAFLRYDPTLGMFDVSYAAAFQLGQLLAIQNKKFAQTLYKYKRRVTHQALENIENKLFFSKIQQQFSLQASQQEDSNTLHLLSKPKVLKSKIVGKRNIFLMQHVIEHILSRHLNNK